MLRFNQRLIELTAPDRRLTGTQAVFVVGVASGPATRVLPGAIHIDGRCVAHPLVAVKA